MDSSLGPSEEFHHPDRLSLVKKFVERFGTEIGTTTTWAFLWLGDIQTLNDLFESRILTEDVFRAEERYPLAQLWRHGKMPASMCPSDASIFSQEQVKPSLLQQITLQPTMTASPTAQSSSPLPFRERTSSESQSQALPPATTASQNSPSGGEFKVPGLPASLALKERKEQQQQQQLPPDVPANPLYTLPTTDNNSKRKHSQSGSSSQPRKYTRSTTARGLARKRDDRTCVITGRPDIAEGAHIYPFHLRSGSTADGGKVSFFWKTLFTFWDRNRVMKFENEILTKGTEVCDNYICMSPDTHIYWDQHRFALKPLKVDADRKSMEVQFFWMPKTQFKREQNLLQMPDLKPNMTPDEAKGYLYNFVLGKVVCSGDIITLKTKDPEKHPLPNVYSLQLQWFLHRLASIRGASEEFSNDNFDDNYSFGVPTWLNFGRSAGIDDESEDEVDQDGFDIRGWLHDAGRMDVEEESVPE